MLNGKPILLSGIQPTGELHLGHYLGAIQNWLKLQQDYQCLYLLVDLHAITVRQDPQFLHASCYNLLALYIAAGLNPEENLIFLQSHVPAHSELAWILNCYAYVGELNRMTQFKDKSKRHAQNVNVGLFAYPVLQAADILLYGTNVVPVGADQKQHLELTRDIALRFNNVYGDIFTIPEPYIPKAGTRIMSLQDPSKKMSKTDENQEGVINLLDAPEVVIKKCKRAITDSGSEVKFDAVNKPGVANLLTIYSLVSGKNIEELERQYVGAGYGKFKGELAEAINAFLAPLQKKYQTIRSDQKYLDDVLRDGASRAKELAELMLDKVKGVLGLVGKCDSV